MRAFLPSAPFLLLLAACSGGFGGKTDDDDDGGGGGGNGGGNGGGDDTGGSSDDLPDLTEDLDTGGCEEVAGAEVPGATSYFVGVYEPSEDGWTGQEQWLLFANDAWEATGEGDCVITWHVVASEGDPGSCAACDLGLSVSASLDEGATDCPEGLWEDEKNFEVGYAVLREEDGTATWYYSSSGNTLGTGYHAGGAMNYITDKACKWF